MKNATLNRCSMIKFCHKKKRKEFTDKPSFKKRIIMKLNDILEVRLLNL